MPIKALPPAPSRAVPSTFSTLADAFLAALSTFVTEANALQTDVNAKQVTASADAVAAAASAVTADSYSDLAQAAANFKGLWVSLSGALAVPASVSHLGRYWMLLSNLANVAAKTPGTDSEWQEIGNVTIQDFQAAVNPKAMSQGVAMTAAESGGALTIVDNPHLNPGANSFALFWTGAVPNWRHTTNISLISKGTSTIDGFTFRINATTGLLAVRLAATTYTSSVSPSLVDGTVAHLVAVVTVGAVNTTVDFYANGYLLGTQQTAANPGSVTTTAPLYIMSSFVGIARYASVVKGCGIINYAPTAAEVLDLYRNGIAEADKWGSQTAVYTTDFSTNAGWSDPLSSISGGVCTFRNVAGEAAHRVSRAVPEIGRLGRYYVLQYEVISSDMVGAVLILAGDSINKITPSNITLPVTVGVQTIVIPPVYAGTAQNLFFDAVGVITSGSVVIDNMSLWVCGATLALQPEGIQPAPGQWLDSSSNKMHAMQPATGSSLTRYKKDFEYRWTNTWTASSAAQYVGGLNKAALSADHFITDIITQATVTADVENLELGDGSAVAKFVAAFTPSATRTKQTVAAQNDGTNLKLVYTPAAEATMTVETIIRGFIWEP